VSLFKWGAPDKMYFRMYSLYRGI